MPAVADLELHEVAAGSHLAGLFVQVHLVLFVPTHHDPHLPNARALEFENAPASRGPPKRLSVLWVRRLQLDKYA